jgi:hypothetical protein
MIPKSFFRKSADTLLQILTELEANAALDRQEPAFMGSLRRRICEIGIDGSMSRPEFSCLDQESQGIAVGTPQSRTEDVLQKKV